MDKNKTKVLTAEDFGDDSKKSKATKKVTKKTPEKESKEMTKGEMRLMLKQTETRYKNQGYGTYPNRKYRRAFLDKNRNKLTEGDIADKITLFEKWCNRTAENIEHGISTHNSYLNLVVQEQIAEEQSKDDHVRKSLIEFYGNKKAADIFRNNKRLQSIREDKKMSY